MSSKKYKVKRSKIPGDLRFTANDQHMADLIAMRNLVDENNNLSMDKIRLYVAEMWKEFIKKQNEYSSRFIPGKLIEYYSSLEHHPGPRTDRDQLELFE